MVVLSTASNPSDEFLQRFKSPPIKGLSNKPLSKNKIFPFDRLPAELKNHIYQLTLTTPEPIFLVSKTKAYRHTIHREIMTPGNASGSHRRSRYRRYWNPSIPSSLSTAQPTTELTPLVPNLLLLNKQIYAEAQPILYGANAFAVEDTAALHSFLANIRPRNVATLTDITINGWGDTRALKVMNNPALTLLASATRLKRLFVNCRIHYSGPKGVARQLFRDGHHWFESLGAAAVEAVEILEENLGYHRFGPMKKIEKEKGEAEMKAELKRMLKFRSEE